MASFTERIGRCKKVSEGKKTWISQKDWEEEQRQNERSNTQPSSFALCFDDSDKKSKVNIMSPMLVDVIKKIIPLSFFESTPDSVSFQEPYAHLFQYSEDMHQELASRFSPSSEALGDFYALKSFLESHGGYGTVWKSLHWGNQTATSFDSLWAIFRAGDLLVSQDRLEEKRLFRFTRLEEEIKEMEHRHDFCVAMKVHFWYIAWNPGKNRFHQKSQYVKIKRFAGHREVTSFPIYPLRYDDEDARNSLLIGLQNRGKKWSDFVSNSPSCFEYSGHALQEEDHTVTETIRPAFVSLFLPDESLLID